MVQEDHLMTASNVGDAVGMLKKRWFVAIVNNNTEKSCAEKLQGIGYDVYVPIQTEERRWRNGKVKSIDRTVISTIVFIHCTELERKEVVKFSFVKRFMTNRAGKKGELEKNPIAVIPDKQIDILRFMLDNSDVPVNIESLPLKLGDKIRVIRGKLRGLEGNIINDKNSDTFLIIRIDLFGCAKLSISPVDVERI